MNSSLRTCSIVQAAETLKKGLPAIFPTDTVLGVGVAVSFSDTPEALFDLKGRERNKPIAWLVGSESDLDNYGKDVPDYANICAREWWPGALTLIVNASDKVSRTYCSEAGTIGLRMPDSKEALELISEVGCPIATTSANPSHAPTPYRVCDLDEAFASSVGAVVSNGEAKGSGVASTIIDCTGVEPRVIREGAITRNDIDRLLSREA